MNRIIIFFFLIPASFQHWTEAITQPQVKPSFDLPEIPQAIGCPEDRALYLAQHYWDNFNFAEDAWNIYPGIAEQALVDYIDLLNIIQPQDALLCISDMIQYAEKGKATFKLFGNLCEKYLYKADSPFWSEELYIPVLECLIASPEVTEKNKVWLRQRLKQVVKNRVGKAAADFTYAITTNKAGTLYALEVEYTILIFYNPECQSCTQIINAIRSSEIINRMSRRSNLALLAFYPENKPDIWKQYASKIPSGWLNGYDKNGDWEIKGIYDLRAMPTLYLLNKSKIVILKNTSLEKIEQYFKLLSQ